MPGASLVWENVGYEGRLGDYSEEMIGKADVKEKLFKMEKNNGYFIVRYWGNCIITSFLCPDYLEVM